VARILITGAGGFTGRYLVRQLAAAGHDVHGTMHADDALPVEGLSTQHPLDLADQEEVSRIVANVAPEKVVHLAAISFVGHRDVHEMYRTNVVGTRNLFDALAHGDVTPSAVVLASSANIYGNATEGVLDESCPPAPVNDYAVTKAAAELVAGLYRKRLPVIIARPFNYTGRGQSERFLAAKIVAHARRRDPEIELGNLDVARDFSDVRGVTDAYCRLLDRPAAIGETFNICSGRATALRELIELVERISGHRFKVHTNPRFVRSDEVATLCGSPRKLEQAIGPLSMPPLEETLRWMIEN
jgi:nucleoside-diphosphate-sugar epimerase